MIERYWNADYLATVFGMIFVAVGILGFIPNPIVSESGYFLVNTAHNLGHMLIGAILLASPFFGAPALTIRVVAIFYAAIAILGFIAPEALTMGGLIAANQADNWLHAALAVVLLFVGFVKPMERSVTTAHM